MRFRFSVFGLMSALLVLPLVVRANNSVPDDDNRLESPFEMLPGVITVVESRGVPQAIVKGKKHALKTGSRMVEGVRVETGKRGKLVVVFTNGMTCRLGPETVLEVTEFKVEPYDPPRVSLLILQDEPSHSATRLRLLQGEVLFHGKNLYSQSSFAVETPFGGLALRLPEFPDGQTFRLKIAPQRSELLVWQGLMKMATTHKELLLAADRKVEIAPGGATTVRNLPWAEVRRFEEDLSALRPLLEKFQLR